MCVERRVLLKRLLGCQVVSSVQLKALQLESCTINNIYIYIYLYTNAHTHTHTHLLSMWKHTYYVSYIEEN